MSEKYKIGDAQIPHFITITVINWLPIFTNAALSEIVLKSLRYCQENKGLIIHAWCIMASHIHLIVSCKKSKKLSSIVRDFKKFTSVSIVRHLEQNDPSDPNTNFLDVFKITGLKSSKHAKYKVWKDGYHPVELSTNQMQDQRLDYIHYNPVKSGYVAVPEDYNLSSATDYFQNKKGSLNLVRIS